MLRLQTSHKTVSMCAGWEVTNIVVVAFYQVTVLGALQSRMLVCSSGPQEFDNGLNVIKGIIDHDTVFGNS